VAEPVAKPPRRVLVTLAFGAAIALAIGGRYAWNTHAARAPEAAANAFVRDLFSGEPRRAFEATSRRYRARNDAASFEVGVEFQERDIRGSRAELRGSVNLGDAAIPVTVVLVREDGSFRVDDFHIDP
jgi:hypothetical protein